MNARRRAVALFVCACMSGNGGSPSRIVPNQTNQSKNEKEMFQWLRLSS